METTAAFRGLDCTACGHRHDAEEVGRCRECGGLTRPVYELASVDTVPLPFPDTYTAGEGETPLVSTTALADELGVERAFVKDEARNPTGTVADRGMALAVTAAEAIGAEPVALAAPGNAAQSAAAYASRAGLRSYGFVPSRTAFSNKAMVNVHGGEMQVVGGRYDDALAALDDRLATEYGPLGAFETPYRRDGLKTVVYETVAAFGDQTDDAQAPDTLVVPVGTGELLVGVATALTELREMGRLDRLPTVVAVQPEGCAPIATAVKEGRPPEPWETPDTIVGELEVPDPVGAQRAVAALDRLDGRAVTVTDDEALESAVSVAQTEVLELGGAGGVAAAGAWQLAERDELGDSVVIVNPDAGVKTPDILRSHLMGQGL